MNTILPESHLVGLSYTIFSAQYVLYHLAHADRQACSIYALSISIAVWPSDTRACPIVCGDSYFMCRSSATCWLSCLYRDMRTLPHDSKKRYCYGMRVVRGSSGTQGLSLGTLRPLSNALKCMVAVCHRWNDTDSGTSK